LESIGIEPAETPEFWSPLPPELFAFDAQDHASLPEIQKEIDASKIPLGFCTASVAFLFLGKAEQLGVPPSNRKMKNLGWDPDSGFRGRCGMRHLFLAAFMMVGALAVTFGAASTLQGWATSRSYASNVATPAMIAPVAKATESGTQRARLHVSPRQASIIDQLAESKI
jgi:hypothetical protein